MKQIVIILMISFLFVGCSKKEPRLPNSVECSNTKTYMSQINGQWQYCIDRPTKYPI